jgi:hypothetical protein
MLTIDSMFPRMKKDVKPVKAEKTERQYDAFVFAIEILITLFLLVIIYLVFDL